MPHMKKIIILIVVIAGISGLISLMNHKTSTVANANAPKKAQATATPGTETAGATYKDGSYTGDSIDVGYGPVQAQIVVSGGKITDVNFLKMPSDQPHSVEVTNSSEPILKQETIQAQSAKVDSVSGAT